MAFFGMARSYLQAGDRNVPFGAILKRTLHWIIPYRNAFRARPIFSLISILFHVGLIVAPLFLYAHVALLQKDLGFGWPTLPGFLADTLTILAATAALLLIGIRLLDSATRSLSRMGDYFWLVMIVILFVSGFFCLHTTLSPLSYKVMLLVHILTGELIFIMIPFSKIAHCVLFPFTQLIADLGWRFPAGSGEKVGTTLGK